MTLRAGVFNLPPYGTFETNKNGEVFIKEGSYAHTLADITKSLNFSVKFVMPPGSKIGGVFPNGTGYGLLGDTVKKNLEIVWGPMAPTLERLVGGIKGGRGLRNIEIFLQAARRRTQDQNRYGVFSTFSIEVYCLTAVAIIVGGLILKKVTTSGKFSFNHLIAWITMGSIPMNRMKYYNVKPASVVVVGSFMFFSIIISNLFSSEMKTALTVQEGSRKIRSMADLAYNFKKTKILLWRNTLPYYYLRSSKGKVPQKIFERIVRDDSVVSLDGLYTADTMRDYATGKAVFFADLESAEDGLSRYCSNYLDMCEVYASFSLVQTLVGPLYGPHVNETIQKQINTGIQRSFESQLTHRPMKDKGRSIKFEACKTSFSHSRGVAPLSVKDLFSVFVLYGILMGVAVFELSIERIGLLALILKSKKQNPFALPEILDE